MTREELALSILRKLYTQRDDGWPQAHVRVVANRVCIAAWIDDLTEAEVALLRDLGEEAE